MANKHATLSFERNLEEARILSPLAGFKETIHKIEHRRDPLTGHRSIIGLDLLDKYKTIFGDTDSDLVEQLAHKSASRCFFCSEKVYTATPRFLDSDLPEGRVAIGEATLFPNLYPLAKYHALIVVCKKHFLKPTEFSVNLLTDVFRAAQLFISKLPKVKGLWASVNCNYMPPAGASAFHPHFQVIVDPTPTNYVEEMDSALRRYYNEQGALYWEELIKSEKILGERYVGKTGQLTWLAAFSPRGMKEVIGVCPPGNFCEFDTTTITSLAEGVSRTLRFYGRCGHSAFNISMNLGQLQTLMPWHRHFIRLMTRQNMYPNYRSSEYFFQHMLKTEVLIITPENVAEGIRAEFERE